MSVPMNPPFALHIDHLVLDGVAFTPAQGARMRRALEHEFARLWAQRGATPLSHGFAGAALSAPAVSIGTGAAASPARLGRDVARSLFTLLGSA